MKSKNQKNTIRKTNVLYILNSSSGGATQGIVELISKIDRNVYNPYIITPNKPNIDQEYIFRQNTNSYEIINMDWWNKKYKLDLIKRMVLSISSLLKTAFNIITIYKIIRKIHQWDIDIVHTSTALTLQGAIAAKLTNKPHIWHIRENIGTNGQYKFWVPDFILIKIFNYLSNFIALESKFAGEIFFQADKKPSKVTVIYDGVDSKYYKKSNLGRKLRQQLNIRPDQNLIGMVASLSATMKRHDIFIDVASTISKTHKDTVFVIFGDEPKSGKRLYNHTYMYVDNLKTKVSNLDMGNQFIWGGFVANIPELMSSIDILVHPCPVEGFGRIAIEAMAAGKPVVGPKKGGVSETVKDSITGILVEPDNVLEFTKATETLTSNKGLRISMGNKGKERVMDKFSIEAHVAKVTNLYDDLQLKYNDNNNE